VSSAVKSDRPFPLEIDERENGEAERKTAGKSVREGAASTRERSSYRSRTGQSAIRSAIRIKAETSRELFGLIGARLVCTSVAKPLSHLDGMVDRLVELAAIGIETRRRRFSRLEFTLGAFGGARQKRIIAMAVSGVGRNEAGIINAKLISV